MPLLPALVQKIATCRLPRAARDVLPLSTVDGRTGRQWLLSARAYCEFRSGDVWHSPSDTAHRRSAERWDWLDAIRLLTRLTLLEELRPMVLPGSELVIPPPGELELLAWKRRELAAALVQESTRYNDARLLAGLPKAKLAHMLYRVREDAALAARGRA